MIIIRYRDDNPKVALVNPDDLAMLEASHDLLQALGGLEPPAVTEVAHKALRLEDRPDDFVRVEDPEGIAAILQL